MDYIQKYRLWCEKANDKEIQSELKQLNGSDKEIAERFTFDLAFGTAGLRGIMGAGTAYMNIYTVARVTEGLARYMADTGGKSVVISFDTRNNSRLFADTARNVLEHFGISTYIFSEPHPVPLLSYAVRHLRADYGIMITASHNPREYNGYKLYNRLGAQLADEASKVLAKYIEEVPLFNDYISAKKAEPIDGQIQENYYNEMERFFSRLKNDISADIIYTSIHGSGLKHVKALFDRFDVKYRVVEKQADFNGDFPTVDSPNPENKEALSIAVQGAIECGAEVVIATDPDADRMAAAVRCGNGEFCYLDGNQTGALLIDFALQISLGDTADMPDGGENKVGGGTILKSFVSTNMVDRIAAKQGVKVEAVGVGFKNIAEKMSSFSGGQHFIFGFEESCGYLSHTLCRDKDGVSSTLLFALMAGYYKSKNMTVLDRLEQLYSEHGYFIDKSVSTYYEGLDGFKTMQKIMTRLFECEPDTVGGKKVLFSRPYRQQHNSLYLELEGGSFVCVRPSGTEPKLKYYIGATASTKKDAQRLFDDIKADMECRTKP